MTTPGKYTIKPLKWEQYGDNLWQVDALSGSMRIYRLEPGFALSVPRRKTQCFASLQDAMSAAEQQWQASIGEYLDEVTE